MNKQELIRAVAQSSDIPVKEAEKIVNRTFSIITDTLAEGERVQIVGFGSFEVRDRSARTARDPRTQETVEVPATRVPIFKAGNSLKKAVAGE